MLAFIIACIFKDTYLIDPILDDTIHWQLMPILVSFTYLKADTQVRQKEDRVIFHCSGMDFP